MLAETDQAPEVWGPHAMGGAHRDQDGSMSFRTRCAEGATPRAERLLK
jgi:hypothetical protein